MFLTRNIREYISNKHICWKRDMYYKCESHKLERNNFPIPLYLSGYSALFTLSLPTALVVYWLAWKTLVLGVAGRTSAKPTFMLILFYFFY